MIVVTTPNGRIGSQVLRKLLDLGEPVRVISHDVDKLPQRVGDLCEVVSGSIDDVDTLRRGFAGAESVFWCIPQTRPGNLWSDASEYHLRFANAAAQALRGTRVRVVAASAGRHGYDDRAIVSAFTAVENTINSAGTPVRHLRSAFFMENLLESLPVIMSPGAVFYNGPGDLPLPMVCVADVAAKAAELLLDRSWHDRGHLALHGPAHVSFDAMASTLADVLGRDVQYIQVPDNVLIDNLVRAGMPEGFAMAYSRLLTAEALKAYDIEPRTPETTTATTLRDWAVRVLRPTVEAQEAKSRQ